MNTTRLFLAVAFGLALPAAARAEDAPPAAEKADAIKATTSFLMAWGKGNWDSLKEVASDKVEVSIGDKKYSIDIAGQKSAVKLVFPFHHLSTVRGDDGSVRSVEVESLTLNADGSESHGGGKVSLTEQDGKFVVTAVSLQST